MPPRNRRRRRPGPAGFTLVEMLCVVAVLVILLGMMVSLARHVRERAARALTKDLLRQLDETMSRYVAGRGGVVPTVPPFPPMGLPGRDPPLSTALLSGPDADRVAAAAVENNLGLVKLFQMEGGPVGRAGADRSLPEGMLSGLPPSVYDGHTLRDAWGSPVVFMPARHPWVGTAPLGKPYFFVSAGPDRDFLTRTDNLYSYEEAASATPTVVPEIPPVPATGPAPKVPAPPSVP